MNRKSCVVLMIVLIMVLSVSCSRNKFDIKVISPLDFYTPVISSVPGFPLEVILPDEGYLGEYKFKWTAKSGKFLDWADDGTVTILGRKAILNVNEIFWTPLEESGDFDEETQIEVQLIRIDGGTVDSKLKFNIILRDDGLYVLDNND